MWTVWKLWYVIYPSTRWSPEIVPPTDSNVFLTNKQHIFGTGSGLQRRTTLDSDTCFRELVELEYFNSVSICFLITETIPIAVLQDCDPTTCRGQVLLLPSASIPRVSWQG